MRVFARVHARIRSQYAQKVSQTSHSCAWSWPKSVFVRLFFSSTHLVVSCVSVKGCEIPPARDERKPLDDSNGHEWFKEAEIVGSTGGYYHNIYQTYYFLTSYNSFIQYVYTDQIIFSNSYWTSQKCTLKFFSLFFFKQPIDFFFCTQFFSFWTD